MGHQVTQDSKLGKNLIPSAQHLFSPKTIVARAALR